MWAVADKFLFKTFRHCCGDPSVLLTLLSDTAPAGHVLNGISPSNQVVYEVYQRSETEITVSNVNTETAQNSPVFSKETMQTLLQSFVSQSKLKNVNCYSGE